MRILVTGGTGYIGSHICRLLLQEGHDVLALDNLSRGRPNCVPPDRLCVADVRDEKAVRASLRAHAVETVIHCAALALVSESLHDPARYHDINVGGTLALLNAMLAEGVTRIVFASSAAVYGNPTSASVSEADEKAPISPYGATKLACEQALERCTTRGLGHVTLRYFNVAGSWHDGDSTVRNDSAPRLIPSLLTTAESGNAFVLYGTDFPTPDGTCVRDFVHVQDVASANALALRHVAPGRGLVFNLGLGRSYSAMQVIETVERVTRRTIRLEIGPRHQGDPAHLVCNPDHARTYLGWVPRFTTLDDIVYSAWTGHQRESALAEQATPIPG